MPLSIEDLGARVAEHRGAKGIRAAAQEIGVSPATLSRIENGNVPDLETFARVCAWLNVDPADYLGFRRRETNQESVAVHFRKGKTVSPRTAEALANMILAAQKALLAREELTG